jgi:hypothetical protein
VPFIDMAYERSIALHAAVAERLVEDPAILDRARRKLAEWISQGGRSVALLRRWQDILARSPREVAQFLTARTEESAWLRSASPFAGVLDPRARLEILRRVRRQQTAAR